MDLRRGAQRGVDAVIEFLEKNKRAVTTSEEIAQVSGRDSMWKKGLEALGMESESMNWGGEIDPRRDSPKCQMWQVEAYNTFSLVSSSL